MQSYTSTKESFLNLLEFSIPDVVLANETWLKPSIHNSELLPTDPPYTIHRRDRSDGYGGVLIAIKDILFSDPIDVKSECEILCRSIENPGGDPVIVMSANHPPSSSKEYAVYRFNAVKDICVKYPKSIFILGGDLNLPDISWPSNSIVGYQYL